MKPVIIIAIAFVLLIPINAYAGQWDEIALSANYVIVEEGDTTIAVVDVEITNNSNKIFEVFYSPKFVIDDQERKFSTSADYKINLKYDCETYSPDVNPGLTKSATYCFEIPSNTTLVNFQIQDGDDEFCSIVKCATITVSFPESQTQIDPPSLQLDAGSSDTASKKIPDWAKNKWTDNIFDWHKQGLISSNEFINALGYLSDNKIGNIHAGKIAGTNIATSGEGFDYNHPAFKNQGQSGYDYSAHDKTIFKYQHSNGIEYKIVKQYDGTLVGYLDDKYISSYSSCYWC